MATELSTRDTNRPYPPPSNVISVLHRLRSRNLPDRIDLDYLRDAGISDSLVQRVAVALRFLGLVEFDTPTEALRAISTSTDEEYREILAGLVQDAYAEVFAVINPAEDGQDRILNVFRRYSPASQRGRMVNFFLGMCREAGIPTLDVPRQRATGDTSKPPRSQSTRSLSGKTGTPSRRPSPKAGYEERETVSERIPETLQILIKSLPPNGATMDAAQRGRWLKLAEAALVYAYPEADASLAEGGQFDEVDAMFS